MKMTCNIALTIKGWFAWFRFYGPEEALFDKSWTMPDIEKVK